MIQPVLERIVGEQDPRVKRSRKAALAAARDLLFEGGWSAVTHAAVSERCGIGRSTLYRHWSEPSELLHDVLTEGMHFKHSTPTGDVRADLIAEVEVLRRQLRVPLIRQVMTAVIDRARNDPALSALPREMHARGSSVLRNILRDAHARGDLRAKFELERGVAELLGPIFFLGMFMGEPPKRKFVTALVDDFIQVHGTGQS